MSIVKSFSVDEGDMFYICHNSSNFTIIDCFMNDSNKDEIVNEILEKRKDKNVTRFISTHPDEDHIGGLEYLDEKLGLVNFYCVKNEAVKNEPSDDFKYYCKLRDGEHHYYFSKGCKRMWMNDNDENDGKNYGSSGIEILWPVVDNEDYIDALEKVKNGTGFNNISPIITYSIENNARLMWIGDMEQDFLEKIKDEVKWPEVDVLFAPHHGRNSGKVPKDILDLIKPKVIVIGEAPSEYLNYYDGYNTLTQNSTEDIVFECIDDYVHIYVSSDTYTPNTDFLVNKNQNNTDLGNYIGSFIAKDADN